MLTRVFFNLIVAMVWVLLKGEVNLVNLVWGFTLGFLVQVVFYQIPPGNLLARRVGTGFVLLFVFLWEIAKANLQVLAIVLSINPRTRSGIIALPLDVKTDWGITLLANMITLTPGTTTMGVAPDRKVLYIHVLDMEDPEEVKRSIKETFERRIREVFEAC
ncbi:MAG: Na+/H+ antiporter subunit E [Bacillota bacterium]